MIVAVGVGTQWSSPGNQARQMLHRDVHCRSRDHHRALPGNPATRSRCPSGTLEAAVISVTTRSLFLCAGTLGDHVTGRPLPGGSGGRKPAALQRWDAGYPGSWRQNGLWGLQQLLSGHGQDLVLPRYVGCTGRVSCAKLTSKTTNWRLWDLAVSTRYY